MVDTAKPPILRTLAFDPAVMAARGRIGGYVTHSRHDSRELTQPARDAFRAKIEREVDPEGKLPEAERLRRAESARRAHYARIALKRRTTAKTKAAAGDGPAAV